MDGVGGSTQEITWQRYNGVRRSKFIAPGETYEDRAGRRFHGGRTGTGDLWTEITKDLVVREALDELGYEFEETEYFFYVIEYLRYVRLNISPFTADALDAWLTQRYIQEQVHDLVVLSDDIRRERRERVREIQWDRRRPIETDERIIERDREVFIARPPRYY
jgi:hypothetical protein